MALGSYDGIAGHAEAETRGHRVEVVTVLVRRSYTAGTTMEGAIEADEGHG